MVTFHDNAVKMTGEEPGIPFQRVSQGFWGTREHWQNIEGNKGTLANFWKQGNKISKNYSTKTF